MVFKNAFMPRPLPTVDCTRVLSVSKGCIAAVDVPDARAPARAAWMASLTVADLSLFGWLICTIVDDSNHSTLGSLDVATRFGRSIMKFLNWP